MQALMVKWNFSVKIPPVPYLSLLKVLVSKQRLVLTQLEHLNIYSIKEQV